MSDRDKLRYHIHEFMQRMEEEDSIVDAWEVTARVMDSLDSWIEENSGEEIRPGVTVKLKRPLKQEDGSMTDQVCEIAEPMEHIDPHQPCGEVILVSDGEAYVQLFYGDAWYIHTDDLEVTH